MLYYLHEQQKIVCQTIRLLNVCIFLIYNYSGAAQIGKDKEQMKKRSIGNIRDEVRSITKKIWKKYKAYILVELMVVIMLVVSIHVMYKMTYELQHKIASDVVEDFSEYIYEDRGELGNLSVDRFIEHHYIVDIFSEMIDYKYTEENIYAYSLEVYNKYNELIGSIKSNEYIMIKQNMENDEYEYKCINLNKYFSEEEINKFEEFCEECNKEYEKNTGYKKDAIWACINKAIGYYDNEDFIPVEIEFYYTVTNDDENKEETTRTFTLKNEKSAGANNQKLISIVGWDGHSEVLNLELMSMRHTKESNIDKLDYFAKVYEDNPVEPMPDYGAYEYWEYEEIIDSGWENIYSNGEKEYSYPIAIHTGEEAIYFGDKAYGDIILADDDDAFYCKLKVCVNLRDLTIVNPDFQKNVKIAIVLFQLMGIWVMIVLNKYEKRGKYFDSMKYTFINAIAHEMKTPAAVLVNSVECIEDGIYPEKNGDYLEKIKKESLHINRLLMDMLAYNKLSDVQSKLVKEKISVKEVLEEVLEHHQGAIENKGIEVQWEITSDSVIRADRKLMEMVVDNYLSNAVKYCKGIIKITVDKDKIVVYNNGDYIHPEKLGMIWEPLYVTDESRKRREGSSGMGLAISAKILELHGFGYKAENRKVGVEFSIITKML